MTIPRRKADIERILSWAYRQELPKQTTAPVGADRSPLAMLVEYGTQIQEMTGGNAFYECVFDQTVHKDAVTVHEAVGLLDKPGTLTDWDIESRELLADMPTHVQAEAESALADYQIKRWPLVMRCARFGQRPGWKVDPPELKVVRAQNGKPKWFIKKMIDISIGRGVVVGQEQAEVDGWDPKGRVPLPGAYHKYYFDPDVKLLIELRADYWQWHRSLVWLAKHLTTRLEAWEPMPPMAAPLPWVTGETSLPRILETMQ